MINIMYTTKDISVKGEPLKEAMRFFQRFPLFFSNGRAKHARLLHHAYFPSPVPSPLSWMPYRGLCYLNALPVLHLYRATGYLREDGKNHFRLQTARVNQNIPPTNKTFSISASPGFVQPVAQYLSAWNISLPGLNKPWNSLSPEDKEHLALLRKHTPPAVRDRDTSLYLDLKTGNVSNEDNGGMEIKGRVAVSPVSDQRIRVRDYEPNPSHEFWDFAGLYEWYGLRKYMGSKQTQDVANFVSRYMCGGTWHQATLLFEPVQISDDTFDYRLRYAADPYSVILYAAHHGIIPDDVLESDNQFDKRALAWPWDLYEQQRYKLLASVNPRLNTLMDALYAPRPSSLPPRRNRRRSGYNSRLTSCSSRFRDNR